MRRCDSTGLGRLIALTQAGDPSRAHEGHETPARHVCAYVHVYVYIYVYKDRCRDVCIHACVDDGRERDARRRMPEKGITWGPGLVGMRATWGPGLVGMRATWGPGLVGMRATEGRMCGGFYPREAP